MKGLALTQYDEISGRSFNKEKKWPALQLALNLGLISFEDFALAEFLLKNDVDSTELAATFICHLFKSLREGHLCVKKEQGVLSPHFKQIWLSEPSLEVPGEVQTLLEKLSQEEIMLPDSVLATIVDENEKIPMKPICLFNKHYYLQKYWVFETTALKGLRELIAQRPHIEIQNLYVEGILQRMKECGLVNQEQEEALRKGCNSSLSIICGGPGTGKTYTAGHLVKIFWGAVSENENCHIALAAPTGKAAQNLQKSIEAAFKDMDEKKPSITAKTLHSLLKISGKAMRAENQIQPKLNADLILVDESSMIDARMLSSLFNSIKPGARLILLGDPHQLPPVEAGSLFKEIINVLPKNTVFELKTCLRAELKEIVEISHLVKEGDAASVLECLKPASLFQAVTGKAHALDSNVRVCHELLLKEVDRHIPSIPFHKDVELGDLLKAFNRFRILTPLRRGMYGVNEINRIIHGRRTENIHWGEFYLSPIIISTNDYKTNLFNGEVGVLASKKKSTSLFEEGEFALFAGGPGESFRKIPAILLPKFDYSYAMSIHKSQGSEFDHVLLLLPQGSEKFGREVLYTAVTRAKKKLEIWGEERTIEKTLLNPSLRISGIPLRTFV